ncbi:MAG TPA: type IV pilus assembly protein PilM [Candidatus Saccharimonadales bacterium]|nr:type IV pilus assembly protein PilM [Candidatus Saccharimonadales bacterium]
MKITRVPNFFHDKPLFGMDIGHGSMKVMQLGETLPESGAAGRNPHLIGYGFTTFDNAVEENGIITKPDVIAKAAMEMFQHHLIGDITTRRVALAIPTYRTFTRAIKLPKLKASDVDEAVQLEAEQYIPLPLEELYLDYEIIRETSEDTELFVVAVPKGIVDSYLDLANILGLETVLIEPTLSSSARLFRLDKQSDVPTVIIDFGSLSSDISIFDKHNLVTGTVQGGGVNFTNAIKEKLDVTPAEAGLIKTRYGLGVSKKQADIKAALQPTLDEIIKEIRRMIRYYEERYGTDRPITQVVTTGGGANMPGLSDYFTSALRLAVRRTDPWQFINFKHFQPPSEADKPMYATVAGLALTEPREVFRP